MSVTVQHDEGTHTYSLVADIDGISIPFVTIDGAAVDARIAAENAASEAATRPAATTGGQVSGNTGDDFAPGDFTDNGDGTFTRKADNVQGRFTPSGFEPVTTP